MVNTYLIFKTYLRGNFTIINNNNNITLQCNPCVGWLNANETLRNLTTERAMDLNSEIDKILAETTFQSFDVKLLVVDFPRIVLDYLSTGKDAADLFEPSDGFHPSQLLNEILSDIVWDFLEESFPNALGPVNPFNSQIKLHFGDQGGY